jgi:hypothetical protein
MDPNLVRPLEPGRPAPKPIPKIGPAPHYVRPMKEDVSKGGCLNVSAGAFLFAGASLCFEVDELGPGLTFTPSVGAGWVFGVGVSAGPIASDGHIGDQGGLGTTFSHGLGFGIAAEHYITKSYAEPVVTNEGGNIGLRGGVAAGATSVGWTFPFRFSTRLS